MNLDWTEDAQGIPTEEPPKFEEVPPGEYRVQLETCELKVATKTPGLAYLKLSFKILEGELTGRKIFDSVFLPSPKEYKDVSKANRMNYRKGLFYDALEFECTGVKIKDVPTVLVGRKCNVITCLKKETYKEKTEERCRIEYKGFKPYGSDLEDDLTEKQIEEDAELLF